MIREKNLSSNTSYPKNWEVFSRRIKKQRAKFQCECYGECGENHNGRCTVKNGISKINKTGKIIKIYLNTAHLWKTICDCSKKCTINSHVLVLCPDCHRRYDSNKL